MTGKLGASWVTATCAILLLSSCGITTESTAALAAGKLDGIAATTNVDKNQTLPPGSAFKLTAAEPWVIKSVDVNGPGKPSDDKVSGPTWSSVPLEPGQRSTVTAKLFNPTSNHTATLIRDVVAGPATKTFTAAITPDSGRFGVGIIPQVRFDTYVPKQDRAEITKRLRVTTAPKKVEGSWHWITGDTAAFRPASKFWPGHLRVKVEANLRNALIHGDRPKNNVWGRKNTEAEFKISRAMLINVNGYTKRGYATIDGKVARTFGVSLGKPGYTTRSGIKTIYETFSVKRMTNQGITTSETYDLQVPYAMRITDTGEFFHGAPWNGNVGYANTSHGCTNLTYDTAQWFYNRVLYGDPLLTRGTGRQMETWNGTGALWNMPYRKWQHQPYSGKM